MSRTAPPCPGRISDGSSSASLRIERRFLRGVGAEAGDLVTLLQYAHFSTRDELIDAALESWERSHAEQQIDELESIADPGERLAAVLRMATEFARAGRRRCKRG